MQCSVHMPVSLVVCESYHWWCVSHAAAIKLAAHYQQFADKDLKHI